jgi:hypothetical protein
MPCDSGPTRTNSRCITTCRQRAGAILLLLLLFEGGTSLLANQVDLSLITEKGWVQITVGGDWKVLSLDTKTPVRVALFQIPNPADEGTSDSTNASVILYEVDSPQASARFNRIRREYGKGMKSRIGAWEVFKNDFKQNATNYSGRIAFRDIADVHVSVVFAWPHLSKNAFGYDSEMERTFRELLTSVNGALGKFPKEKGGVLRRPL